MIISSVPGVIEKKSAVAIFAVSLLVTGFGTGGFKANISTLIAEQYKRTKMFVTTMKSGERVIVDPALTISRIYMVRACMHALPIPIISLQRRSSTFISSSTSVLSSAKSQ
jgi:dipeptide/tripeptide permease